MPRINRTSLNALYSGRTGVHRFYYSYFVTILPVARTSEYALQQALLPTERALNVIQ